MSNSLLDIAFNWIGTGAGVPRFCLPIPLQFIRTQHFGDPNGAGVHDSLVAQVPVGAAILAPTNGLLWQVPERAENSGPLAADVLPLWPRLTRIDGTVIDPRRTPASLANFDILIEVWPSAHRRLEYIISSLEIPAGFEHWDLAQMPAPRWFLLRGIGDLAASAQSIAAAQFAGTGIAPEVGAIRAGKVPLYVDAGTQLTLVDDEHERIEIWAFDTTGAAIDPDWVFQIFDILGADSDFTSAKATPAGASAWHAPKRHVLAFCNNASAPYRGRLDPDWLPSDLDVPPQPELIVTNTASGIDPLHIPEHGVLVIEEDNPAYAAAVGRLAHLELPGEHERLTLMPHGTLEKQIQASFGSHSFFRLQVVDFAQWFPKSANVRNDAAGDDALKRYTEGNEIVPLIDGRDMLREVYRAWRATYAIETYASLDHIPALDPDAVIAVPEPALAAKARILLTNAWLEPHTALLGRRALNAAPRTQAEELPPLDDVLNGFVVVGALPPFGIDVPDPAAPTSSLPNHRMWWIVSTKPLPPGVYVEIRQLTIIDKVRGDDPRLPGVVLNEDIFGIVGPLGGNIPTGWGFVGTSGVCVMPALYRNGESPRAHLRAVTWRPDDDDPSPTTLATSGKGKKVIRATGEIDLPVPSQSNREIPPSFSRAGVNPQPELRLEFAAAHSRATVVFAAETLTAPVPVVIINARSGEMIAQTLGPNPADLRIDIEPFALRDRILVGFPRGTTPNPADVDLFFTLEAAPAQMVAASARGHQTEVIGALHQAIDAGVETRLLAWHASDHEQSAQLFSNVGMVAAVNATIGTHRGQSISDSLNRPEFGVHHQKGSFIRTARTTAAGGGVIGFVGGIDLRDVRWDRRAHDGIEPDRQGGPWHDVHCRIRGRAVWDLYRNIRQRWNAARLQSDLVGHDPGWTELPPISDATTHGQSVEDDPLVTLQDGDCTAQINRTLAKFQPFYDQFLQRDVGDLSIQKAYRRMIDEARRFLYIEDQYFWDRDIAQRIHNALFQRRLDFVIMLMPKDVHEAPIFDLMLYAQRRRALLTLLYGVSEIPQGVDPATLPENVSDRVVVFTIRNDFAEPVYVHAKSIVADDIWFSISSSNLSRRSMTYDSEIGVMAIDRRTRRGGQQTAREYRADLMAAHLGLEPDERGLVDDPYDAFRFFKDYFSGKWPGRTLHAERTGIVEMDAAHTHLGLQPADADGTFIDLIDVAADPDGNRELLGFGLLDIRTISEALSSATDQKQYGGLGKLRLTFDVSALGNPADILVTASIKPDIGTESQRVALGTVPASETLNVGVVKINDGYSVRADAAFVATPSTQLGARTELPVTPADFDTLVTVTIGF